MPKSFAEKQAEDILKYPTLSDWIDFLHLCEVSDHCEISPSQASLIKDWLQVCQNLRTENQQLTEKVNKYESANQLQSDAKRNDKRPVPVGNSKRNNKNR